MPILNYKMKDKSWITEIICRCDCQYVAHKLTFEKIFWKNEDGTIDSEMLSVYMANPPTSFWGRVKHAFRYVFRNHTLYLTNDVLFTKDNIEQLEEAIRWIKEREQNK